MPNAADGIDAEGLAGDKHAEAKSLLDW